MTFVRYLYVRIVTAEPEALLTSLSSENIELWDIHFLDLLTVECKIAKHQLSKFIDILRKNGSSYTIKKHEGLLWEVKSLTKRPAIVIGLLIFFVAALVAPTRIFFVNVTGNNNIAQNLILSEAEKCGIRFGARSSAIRSEEVKNQLLGSIPELQWVGITTSGSVATIHVKERSLQEEHMDRDHEVSSVVASRDGVITQMIVKKGNQLFSVGQSVKSGDVLVSGYTDCGIKTVAEDAVAEVFAHTLREIRCVTPAKTEKRDALERVVTCYYLRIGKKVIKLCNHSGISDATCVKMYSENYWTLPGGFRVPVSIIKEKFLFFEEVDEQKLDEDSFQWLIPFARSYLQEEMISGTIIDENLQWQSSDDACILSGSYSCNEMIGQIKYEEILEQNAEDN